MNNLTAGEHVLVRGTAPLVITQGEYAPIRAGAAAVLLNMLLAATAERTVRNPSALAA